MRCPVCKSYVLGELEIADGLSADSCTGCGGMWLRGARYLEWVQGGVVAMPPVREVVLNHDTGPAKFCPECGHYLHHADVGHGIPFTLDRCGSCGGFWLDRGECEMLVRQNLHAELHRVFSPAWQATVARERMAAGEAHVLETKLGAADLAEARRIKRWIDTHAHRAVLYAFLARH